MKKCLDINDFKISITLYNNSKYNVFDIISPSPAPASMKNPLTGRIFMDGEIFLFCITVKNVVCKNDYYLILCLNFSLILTISDMN